LNGDGSKDLVLGGNFGGFLPQFSSLDASYGHVLLNDGAGGFAWIRNAETGLELRGDVKGFTSLILGGKDYLIATINDAAPKVFQRRPVTIEQ
jgi:hypothetical protein